MSLGGCERQDRPASLPAAGRALPDPAAAQRPAVSGPASPGLLAVSTASLPLALYVHIPWCTRKCPYCDFNSHPARGTVPEEAYVTALLRDLEQELPFAEGRAFHSVFIGGGTPSLFSPRAVERLLSGLREMWPHRPDAEVTLEANPGTVDRSVLDEFRSAGVNRLSIGVQSFDDEMLSRLGRIHGSAEAVGAAEAAHTAGFDSFNLDLMFGLPGQDLRQALQDLGKALSLEPPHVSYYQLTIEPNTRFARYPPVLPEEDLVSEIQERGIAELQRAGYERYEVSAYAWPGRRCAHNLNYWLFGDYLGIGAGAHGKVSGPWGIRRRWKVKHPQDYLGRVDQGDHVGGQSPLDARDATVEFMMNALRLCEGFPTRLFAERTGVSLDRIVPRLERAAARGLLNLDAERVGATSRGLRYLNDLVAMFLD
jgi:putative oxygen-independent coproporphyrinogen III oxidase